MINIDIFKKLNYFDLNVKLQVDKEVLVIQGASGSGKTSIFDCVCGINKPDKGRIELNGNTVYSSEEKINLPLRERNIGYVFQNYALFPHMTVKENVLFGILYNKNSKSNIEYGNYIMDVLKIKHLENRYPNEISGGEKQRVALSRALSIKPDIMLLDEPFSALDSETKEIVYKEFITFKKMWDISVILVTHDNNEAVILGDRVINLKDGEILR